MSLKRKVLRWFFILLFFYAVTGFFILPPVIRIVAQKQLSKQLGRDVSIQKLRLNPFVFSATVSGLLIKEKDGRTFLSWDEVYVNFQPTSVFDRAWLFKEISITKPFVRAEMNKDRTFNFSDLITKFSQGHPEPAAKTEVKLPAIRIDEFRINDAAAALADFTPHTPFRRRVGPLNFEMENFCTEPDSKNPFSFSGTTDAGERIVWDGSFSLSPLRAQGDFTLDQLTLNKYAALYQDLARFEIRSGSIGFHASYQLEWGVTNHTMSVTNVAFALRDFKLAEPAASNDIMEVPFFALTGGSVDLQSRQATIDSVIADGSKLFLSRSKNDSINVVELSKPAVSVTNAPVGILFVLHSVTNVVAQLLESTNEWTATIHSVNSTNGSLHFEDRANSRPVIMDLTDIDLGAKNISNLAETNFTSELSLRWNNIGTVRTETTASLRPPVFEIKVDLDNLNLDPLDPYLESTVNLLIPSARLSFHGRAHLKTPRGELPQVSFHGDTRLDDFRAVSSINGEELLKWNSVQVNGLHAGLNPLFAEVKQIVVDSASARLVIETNHTINLLNVLVHSTVTNSPVAKASPLLAKDSETINSSLPPVNVDEIIITNTVADFTDRSLQPNVNLSIEQFNGNVTGISSTPAPPVTLVMNAKVDGVGPVNITGSVSPFSQSATNSVKISIKDVELTPLSAYAGKFAGYGIAEGKFNLTSTFDLTGKKLASENLMVLDQFTFGEKITSPEATHLPVRLAIAILKDRDGKITLDVPIGGNLDDPKFRIGKVVVYAIENILKKVATSPFALLGSMFGGGGEELGYQDFNPGSAELSAADTNKLNSLAHALYARPGLRLEISGSVDAVGDREGLERAALDNEIKTRIWKTLNDPERATNSVAQINFSPEERTRWLTTIYDEAVAAGKITGNTNLTGNLTRQGDIIKGATALMQKTPASPTPAMVVADYKGKLVPPPDPVEAALLDIFPVDENDLQTLAANRAGAVRTYLLQPGKIEAARLFLTLKSDALRRDGSRVYLQFQ